MRDATMRRRRFLVSVATVVLASVGIAHADDAPPADVARQRLGLDAGLASAVGSIGGTYQYAPLSLMRIEGGVGWGPSGAQLSLMPKVAFGSSTCAFVAGFGASVALGGATAAAGHGPNPTTIPWLNLDLPGIECRTRSGFSYQATLGLTMPLVAFHWDVADTGDTIKAGAILPQGRAGIGWWF
jgi:hypothetical protein